MRNKVMQKFKPTPRPAIALLLGDFLKAHKKKPSILLFLYLVVGHSSNLHYLAVEITNSKQDMKFYFNKMINEFSFNKKICNKWTDVIKKSIF